MDEFEMYKTMSYLTFNPGRARLHTKARRMYRTRITMQALYDDWAATLEQKERQTEVPWNDFNQLCE
jgi:hypothetical protein